MTNKQLDHLNWEFKNYYPKFSIGIHTTIIWDRTDIGWPRNGLYKRNRIYSKVFEEFMND